MSKTNYELIGDYLANRLQGSDLEAFEMRILDDAELQSELELELAIKLGLSKLEKETEIEIEKNHMPPAFDRVVYVENMRGGETKVSLDSEETVCVAVDVGPYYFETVEVFIERDETLVRTEFFIVDPEGLVSIPWHDSSRGTYSVHLKAQEIDKQFLIEVA